MPEAAVRPHAYLKHIVDCSLRLAKHDPACSTEGRAALLHAISTLPGGDARRSRAFYLLTCVLPAADESGERFGRTITSLRWHLIKLLCERAPGLVVDLVIRTRRLDLLRDLFRKHAPHAGRWFGGVSTEGLHRFSPGALALATYALKHRDAMWGDLVWGGHHPQAPVTVAAKPHYFEELDLGATLINLLEHDDFLDSKLLLDSLRDGDIVLWDTPYWILQLQALLRGDPDSGEGTAAAAAAARDILKEFLSAQPFTVTGSRLLHLLSDAMLERFLGDVVPTRAEWAPSSRAEQNLAWLLHHHQSIPLPLSALVASYMALCQPQQLLTWIKEAPGVDWSGMLRAAKGWHTLGRENGMPAPSADVLWSAGEVPPEGEQLQGEPTAASSCWADVAAQTATPQHTASVLAMCMAAWSHYMLVMTHMEETGSDEVTTEGEALLGRELNRLGLISSEDQGGGPPGQQDQYAMLQSSGDEGSRERRRSAKRRRKSRKKDARRKSDSPTLQSGIGGARWRLQLPDCPTPVTSAQAAKLLMHCQLRQWIGRQ